MFAVIIVILIIWASMWAFYKFMYPRAPKSMMPKEGDVTTPRQCNFCGNSLAEYRAQLPMAMLKRTKNCSFAIMNIRQTFMQARPTRLMHK